MAENKVTTTANFNNPTAPVTLSKEAQKTHQANTQRLQEQNRSQAKAGDPDTELVRIRANITHEPAPRVGDFKFDDAYGHFRAGVIYTVPRYVAAHLCESGNAISLEIPEDKHLVATARGALGQQISENEKLNDQK